MDTIIGQIKAFVYLQSGLWVELIRECDGQVDSLLLNLPNTGIVEFDGKIWCLKKHGLGVLFEEQKGQRKIDFHSVANGCNYFDAWGLSTYFGSLGASGRKVLQKAGTYSGSLEEQLKDALTDVEADGAIVGNGEGFYRLA